MFRIVAKDRKFAQRDHLIIIKYFEERFEPVLFLSHVDPNFVSLFNQITSVSLIGSESNKQDINTISSNEEYLNALFGLNDPISAQQYDFISYICENPGIIDYTDNDMHVIMRKIVQISIKFLRQYSLFWNDSLKLNEIIHSNSFNMLRVIFLLPTNFKTDLNYFLIPFYGNISQHFMTFKKNTENTYLRTFMKDCFEFICKKDFIIDNEQIRNETIIFLNHLTNSILNLSPKELQENSDIEIIMEIIKFYANENELLKINDKIYPIFLKLMCKMLQNITDLNQFEFVDFGNVLLESILKICSGIPACKALLLDRSLHSNILNYLVFLLKHIDITKVPQPKLTFMNLYPTPMNKPNLQQDEDFESEYYQFPILIEKAERFDFNDDFLDAKIKNAINICNKIHNIFSSIDFLSMTLVDIRDLIEDNISTDPKLAISLIFMALFLLNYGNFLTIKFYFSQTKNWSLIFHPFLYDQSRSNDPDLYAYKTLIRKLSHQISVKMFSQSISFAYQILNSSVIFFATAPVHICAEQISLFSTLVKTNPEHFQSISTIPDAFNAFVNCGLMMHTKEYAFLQKSFLGILSELSTIEPVAMVMFLNDAMIKYFLQELFTDSRYYFYTKLINTSFCLFKIPSQTYLNGLVYYTQQVLDDPKPRNIQRLSQIFTDSILFLEKQTLNFTDIGLVLFKKLEKFLEYSEKYPDVLNSVLGLICSLLSSSSQYYKVLDVIFLADFNFDEKCINNEVYSRLYFIVFGSWESNMNIASANALILACKLLQHTVYYKKLLHNALLSMEKSLINTMHVVFSKFPSFAVKLLTNSNQYIKYIIQMLSIVIHCYFSRDLLESLVSYENEDWPTIICDLIDGSLTVKHAFPRSFVYLPDRDSKIELQEFTDLSSSETFSIRIDFFDVSRTDKTSLLTLIAGKTVIKFDFDGKLTMTMPNNEFDVEKEVMKNIPIQPMIFKLSLRKNIMVVSINDQQSLPLDYFEGLSFNNLKLIIGNKSVCVIGRIIVKINDECICYFDPSNGINDSIMNVYPTGPQKITTSGVIVRYNEDVYQKFINNNVFTYIASITKNKESAIHLLSTAMNLFLSDPTFVDKVKKSNSINRAIASLIYFDKSIYSKDLLSILYNLWHFFQDEYIKRDICSMLWFNSAFWGSLPDDVMLNFAETILLELYKKNLSFALECNSVQKIVSLLWQYDVELLEYFAICLMKHLENKVDDIKFVIDFIEHAEPSKTQQLLVYLLGLHPQTKYNNNIVSKLLENGIQDKIIDIFNAKRDKSINIDEKLFINYPNNFLICNNPGYLYDIIFCMSKYISNDSFICFVQKLSQIEMNKIIENSKFVLEWIIFTISQFDNVLDIALIRFISNIMFSCTNFSYYVKTIICFLKIMKIDLYFMESIFLEILGQKKEEKTMTEKLGIMSIFLFYVPIVEIDLTISYKITNFDQVVEIIDKIHPLQIKFVENEKPSLFVIRSIFEYVYLFRDDLLETRIQITKNQFITLLQILTHMLSIYIQNYGNWFKIIEFFTKDSLIENDVTALSVFLFTCYYNNDRQTFIDLFNKCKNILLTSFYNDENINNDVDSFVCDALAEVSQNMTILFHNYAKSINWHEEYNKHQFNEIIIKKNTDFQVLYEIEKIKNEFIIQNNNNKQLSKKVLLFSRNFEPFMHGKPPIIFIEKESEVCESVSILQFGTELKTIIYYSNNKIVIGGYVISTKDIQYAYKREYNDKKAVELFLNNSIMIFIIFNKNFESFIDFLVENDVNMEPDYTKMIEELFVGNITLNYFLIYLNFSSGKSFNTPKNYPVFPKPRDDLSMVLPEMSDDDVSILFKIPNNDIVSLKYNELTPEFFSCPDSVVSFRVSASEVKENCRLLYSEQSLKFLHKWIFNMFNVTIPSLASVSNSQRIDTSISSKDFNPLETNEICHTMNMSQNTISFLFSKNIERVNLMVNSGKKVINQQDQILLPFELEHENATISAFSNDLSLCVIYKQFEKKLMILHLIQNAYTCDEFLFNVCDMIPFENDSVIGICDDGTFFITNTRKFLTVKLPIVNTKSMVCSEILMTIAILSSDGMIYLLNTSDFKIFHMFKACSQADKPRKIAIFDSGLLFVLTENSIIHAFTISGNFMKSHDMNLAITQFNEVSFNQNTEFLLVSTDNCGVFILNPYNFEVIKKLSSSKPIKKITYSKYYKTVVAMPKPNTIQLISF